MKMNRKVTKGRLAALTQSLSIGEVARLVGISESYTVAILSGRIVPAKKHLSEWLKCSELTQKRCKNRLK